MARIDETRRRVRLTLTKEELNTLTIAMALINIPEMEDEAKEQGLSFDKISYNHNTLFDVLTEYTGLYPKKKVDVEE